jgi:putative colanic acid biosynthesis glycosyltransferase
MRIAGINMIPYGSTGKIMLQIAETARGYGMEVRTYSTIPYNKSKKAVEPDLKNHFVFGSMSENKRHTFLGVLLGRNGCYSRRGTRQLIDDLKQFKPDIVHLHNLHKFCINLPMLFRYLQSSGVRVVWTLHDCWPFTGHCPHFTMVKCEKWKTGCHHCPQLSAYPVSKLDNTKALYKKKKEWFCGVAHMNLVAPSQWLADLVKQSFLKAYAIEVINNGVDLSIFQPTPSDFRQTYHLEGRFIVLGVAFGWGKRKGLDVFIELSRRLDAEKYQIVLVGTDDIVDKQLPSNIISIHRTQNATELAQIYTAADVFVNPTREDNFPTVNIESLACGTPVLTFSTGGSPEVLDETCGCVVDCDDVDAMEKELIRICTETPYSRQACIERAKRFDMYARFGEYIKLYQRLG